MKQADSGVAAQDNHDSWRGRVETVDSVRDDAARGAAEPEREALADVGAVRPVRRGRAEVQ